MRHLGYLFIGLAMFGLLSFTVIAQDRHDNARDEGRGIPRAGAPAPGAPALHVGPSYRHCEGKKVIFVINGVKGSTRASDALLDVNADLGLGLHVEVVSWSRYDYIPRDLADNEAQLHAAYRLACATKALRKDAPRAQIFYLGHSAGARIALVAAEMAGPKSVDRIFLMHAAVSSYYDLKNALLASRCGIDSFYSTGDTVLEVAGEEFCLADGMRGPAGGRNGFRLPCDKRDLELYRNLRQYGWHMELAGLGEHGAWTLPRNMKCYLAPLIVTTPSHEAAFMPMPARVDPRSLPETN